jgi:formylglycine-generating enzyme required for sulfatase activity
MIISKRIKIVAFIVVVAIAFFTFKRFSFHKYVNDFEEPHFTNASFFQNNLRECFQSEKLRKLIPEKKDFKSIKISEKEFNNLNAYDHFVHSFYYPEWYNQSCYFYEIPGDILLKIPALLPRLGDGLVMSKRQQQSISENRDSTIILMQQCIQQTNEISIEFKRAIILLDAFELIPTLTKTLEFQDQKKDSYILTTLCLLMMDYEPFLNSSLCNSLYPKDSIGYLLTKEAYKRAIPFTVSNYETIVDFSSEYYKLKSTSQSEFVKISAGIYSVGQKEHAINPEREVHLKPFQICRYEVTNKQFAQFVKATGYVTLAEKRKDAFVFRTGLDEFEWTQDSTAYWRYPNGFFAGGIEDKMNHPVTCISFVDAQAYCSWAQVRLPSIDEWEVASRANTVYRNFYFGNSIDSIYMHANIWHGKTHLMVDAAEDDITTSPVGSYKSNPLGIFDIYGNVFEFCSNVPSSFIEKDNVVVTRGGSWWCSMYACGFFNSVDIGKVPKEASFSNNVLTP